MILKIIATIVGLVSLACVFLAQMGDNSDVRALSGIFYVPALGLGMLDVLLWIWALR